MCLKRVMIALALALIGGLGLISNLAMAKVRCPVGSLRGTADVDTYAECNIDPSAEDTDLMDKANVIINVIVGVVGIVAVAVIVLGGVTFVTSQGDTAKTAKAKNTIIYGVVGLLVALLAFAIVNFVLKSVF